MTDNPNEGAAFFVGYRPMPAALTRWYRPLAVLLIAASGLGGYWLGAQQVGAGPGDWDTTATVTAQGVLMLRPYPALHRLNPAHPGGVESLLLVRQGKHSADSWAQDFDRQWVSVRGYPVTRGRWTMLEIPGEDAISAAPDSGTENLSGHRRQLRELLEIAPLGAAELAGEIVDSKCFLGVMKPGAGPLHKACAELCLRGGIPPILVAKDAQGQQLGYLLAHADGASASVALAQFAADPVRVTGQLQRQGGLLLLRVDEDGVRRR